MVKELGRALTNHHSSFIFHHEPWLDISQCSIPLSKPHAAHWCRLLNNLAQKSPRFAGFVTYENQFLGISKDHRTSALH